MYEWIKKEFDQQPIYTIYGQHDTEYHSDKVHNTPLNMLRLLGGVKISYNTLLTQKIIVRCFSWFDPIPEPAEKNDMKKILVLHKTISNGYTAFESTDAKTLLDRLNYDLILSGDNHKQFTVTSNGRHLVNPGSLMRSAIDQADHEPAVYIYDTEATRIKDALKRIPLKVAPANEVFDLNRFEQEKELDGKAIMFADEITGNLRGGLDFIDGLKTYLESLPLDHMVKDMLKRVTGGRV
jgi:predicted phosphodiesterase